MEIGDSSERFIATIPLRLIEKLDRQQVIQISPFRLLLSSNFLMFSFESDEDEEAQSEKQNLLSITWCLSGFSRLIAIINLSERLFFSSSLITVVCLKRNPQSY